MKPTKKNVHSQPSFQVQSSTVEAYVTELGGHLAPVFFDRKGRKIQPYTVAPWAGEKVSPSEPNIIKLLRGDFFCCPFGGNEKPYKGEKQTVHGETANNKWKFESLDKENGRTTLHLSMDTKIRKGRTHKLIGVVDGHNAIYSKHIISGVSGPLNFGHHASLKFPDEPGSGIVSLSPFTYGQVFPHPFDLPENGGYQTLKQGFEFSSLKKVAMISGEMTDLTRYPARKGFDDLVQVLADPTLDVAWSAASFPKQRYVWFGLKDPKVLTGTIVWMSNGGAHYAPWSGRHKSVMGLEEVRTYFHYGLAEAAAKNPFNKRGVETVVHCKPDVPVVINYIMGVALTPPGFDGVKNIEVDDKGVTLVSDSGKKAKATIDTGFLKSGI